MSCKHQEEAEQQASQALKLVSGRGWEVHVFENLGWHWKLIKRLGPRSIKCGNVFDGEDWTLRLGGRKGTSGVMVYDCMLGVAGSGLPGIHHPSSVREIYVNPDSAVKGAIMDFERWVEQYAELMILIERFRGTNTPMSEGGKLCYP